MTDFLRHIFLENPLPLWILCGLGALVGLAVWSRTRSFTPLAVAAGFVLAGLVIGLVAYLVVTDRERVEQSVAIIATAAQTADADRLLERISPQYKNGPFTKDQFAPIVRRALQTLHIDADDPLIVMADREATVTQRLYFTVKSGGSQGLSNYPVTWEGTFAPDPDGQWRLRSCTATSPERMTPEAAARYLH
jgi:hypothetical protein